MLGDKSDDLSVSMVVSEDEQESEMSMAGEKYPLPRCSDTAEKANALLPHRGDKNIKPTAQLPHRMRN